MLSKALGLSSGAVESGISGVGVWNERTPGAGDVVDVPSAGDDDRSGDDDWALAGEDDGSGEEDAEDGKDDNLPR